MKQESMDYIIILYGILKIIKNDCQQPSDSWNTCDQSNWHFCAIIIYILDIIPDWNDNTYCQIILFINLKLREKYFSCYFLIFFLASRRNDVIFCSSDIKNEVKKKKTCNVTFKLKIRYFLSLWLTNNGNIKNKIYY